MNRLASLRLFTLLPLLFLASCVNQQRPATTQTVLPALPGVSDTCPVGCPAGGSAQTLTRAAYTLNNNGNTRFANWVAYRITKTSQASGRSRSWKQDPQLPAAETLAPADYKDANKVLAVDRGHQAPLAGLGGAADWEALNYLSNITPQKSALNQGAWARLEDKERALANREDVSAVYSVTGPLFGENIGTLPAEPTVKIPVGYWKIIFIGSGPDKGKYSAFLLRQDLAKSADFCDYQVSVSTIEQQTTPHLTIWPALPADVAALIKSKKGTLAQDAMGCL